MELAGLDHLGFVLCHERESFRHEGVAFFFAEWRRKRGAGGDGDAYLAEELILARGRADAQHARGFGGGIVELVRCVCRDVNGGACGDGGVLATEGGFELAFEKDEGFFKIVTMRRRATTRRDEHVDETKLACGVFARK